MSFPKYERYKDSGVEWLGEVPEHWSSKRLKFLFHLVKRDVRDDDRIITCFRDGQVTLRDNRRTEGFTNALKEIGYQGIRVGDLIIHAMDAFAGAIGVSDSEGKSSPVYSVCVPASELISANYYARLLRNMALSGFVASLSKGIRERSTDFRWADAGEIFLPVPSLEEQTQIAQFLDHETTRIDALITEQERLIALLKEKRQAVISHAVTKGLDSRVPMKDSGVEWLGEVPEHWKTKSYRYSSEIYRGKFGHRPRNDPSLYDGDFAFIQTGDIARADKYIHSYKQTLNDKGASVSQRFPAGTLVMAIAANVGDTAILGFEAYAPDSVVGFKPNSNVDIEFLRFSLIAAIQELQKSSTQSTQANLNIDRIGSIRAVFPSFPEQKAIANYLNLELERYSELESQVIEAIQLLQERRSALISAAVTGKIDVRNWQP
jgi:type I restriction enzyme, S subunit